MANTKINWTNKSWNLISGCTKISQGCQNCYAEIMTRRLNAMGQAKYSEGFNKVIEHLECLNEPFKWKKPQMIFVNSMSDTFHKDVSVEFIAQIYTVMFLNPQHTFQILTKRPERRKTIMSSLPFNPVMQDDLWKYCNQFHNKFINNLEQELYFQNEIMEEFPLKNVWEGVTVESNKQYDRIKFLQDTPAKVRFLSCEPLLTELPNLPLANIDWVIVGGESGNKARPIYKRWVIDIKEQCKKANVQFFFKQWSSFHDFSAFSELGIDLIDWQKDTLNGIEYHNFPNTK